jgi:hypothetical protein
MGMADNVIPFPSKCCDVHGVEYEPVPQDLIDKVSRLKELLDSDFDAHGELRLSIDGRTIVLVGCNEHLIEDLDG